MPAGGVECGQHQARAYDSLWYFLGRCGVPNVREAARGREYIAKASTTALDRPDKFLAEVSYV